MKLSDFEKKQLYGVFYTPVEVDILDNILSELISFNRITIIEYLLNYDKFVKENIMSLRSAPLYSKYSKNDVANIINENASSYTYESDNSSSGHKKIYINQKPFLNQSNSTHLCTSNQCKIDMDEPNIITNKSSDYEFVNHPSHYNKYDMETIDMMEKIWGTEATILWCQMTAFKYRMRLGEKPNNPIQQDLNKEQWYLDKANQLKSKLF